MEKLLEKDVTLKLLAEKISICSDLKTNQSSKNEEAWSIVHSLSDMEESFHKIYNEYLIKLLNNSLSQEEINDILLDIGEELRHISYHIKAPRFYKYLNDEQ